MLCLDAHVAVAGCEHGSLCRRFYRLQLRTYVSGEPVVPVLVADVLLSHHTVPFATCYLLVVLQIQQRVALEGLATALCPAVSLRIALCRQLQIHRLGIIHLVDVAHRLYGEEDDLAVGILAGGLQRDKLAQGTCLEGLILSHHLGELVSGIGPGVEHLRGDAAIILAHEVQQLGSLTGLLLAEALCTEVARMVEQIIHLVLSWIPGHIHKQLDGILHGLQVAHVQDPQLLDAAVIGQLQLFPHILDGGHVDPLRIAWCSHVVHVVVESPAAFALLLLSRWQSSDVTPVVVAEQHRHVVRHPQSCVVVVLHLLIEGPYLCRLLGRALGHLLDDAPLVVDDALQQLRVRTLAHGLVAVATHADGDDVVSALGALDTLTEEAVEVLLVRGVVPGAPTLTVTGIFLVVACHRLVVRGTHHDTHRVSSLQVLRVVGIESPSPHGRPQVVTLQTQDQLEHFLVETVVAVVRAEGVLHPRGQTGCLVVEEQAAIPDGRFAVCVFTLFYI